MPEPTTPSKEAIPSRRPSGIAAAPQAPSGRVQSATGLDAIWSPRRLVVVGASPDPGNVGHRLFAAILANGYTGEAIPVHPKAPEVLGRPAYPTVEAVPGPVDLAVVAVPAQAVLGVVEACARKGVRGIVLVSAGFRETGPEGVEREQRLAALLRASGMRLVGPNCLGILNADPAVRLHAVFADMPVHPGGLAIMTQSGALGIALVQRAHDAGLGVARFASMGNKLDVSGNDLLLCWEDDPQVTAILVHLESVGNPRNFVRIARRVAAKKPVLLVKGGRTAVGAKAAGSHTGAMMQPDALVDAMVEQAGVLRCATVEEMFEVAQALSQPLPAGPRVAIATNSGGPAILAADALAGCGLALADLQSATLERCRKRLPAEAAVANPLDLLAGATPATLTACLTDLAADPGVDALIALVTPLAADDTPWADAIVQVATRKPRVAVLFGRDANSPGAQRLAAAKIPCYAFPENAARALGALRALQRLRDQPLGHHPELAGHIASAKQRLARAVPDAQGWLPTSTALEVAAALGLGIPAMRLAATPEVAGEAARQLGGLVALKAQAPGLVHKSDVGGVRLGLDPSAVQAAAMAMQEALAQRGLPEASFLVQAMAPPGVDVLVGAVRDPQFGPVVSFGLGGIHTEILHDVAFRLAPVTDAEAHRQTRSIRGYPILAGVRGAAPSDVAAAEQALAAIGQLLDQDAQVQEFEVNPLRLLPQGQGAVAVDVRIRVVPP